MDNVLVVGRTRAEQNKRLTIMLQRLEKAGLKLKLEKCEFNNTEVEYLGHVISNKGIHASEKMVSAVIEATEPRKFLPNLSAALRPLYALLQKNRPWKWTQGHKEAFIKAKQHF